MSAHAATPKPVAEKPADHGNVNKKLKESFSNGNSARSQTKEWAKNAQSIATRIFIIFFVLITTFSCIPQLKEAGLKDASAPKMQRQNQSATQRQMPTERTVSQDTVPRERVTSVNLILPAKGRVATAKSLRCNGHSITDEILKDGKVTRVLTEKEVIFTSTRDENTSFTIWFYDEGGDCTSDFRKLIALGLIK